MKAILLAAGEGKRMLPLTLTKPKPMLEVLGKPLLEHILESFPSEISEFIIVVGYMREVIESYFGDAYRGKPITYIVQPSKTGTADALKLCEPLLESGERFLLTYADDVYDGKSIASCLEHPCAMLVAETDEPQRYGVVELDQNGTVKGIEEKPENPKSNLVAPGVYVLDTRIFSYEPKMLKGEYYFTTMLEQFIKDHELKGVPVSFWATIGYPEDLERAEKLITSFKSNT